MLTVGHSYRHRRTTFKLWDRHHHCYRHYLSKTDMSSLYSYTPLNSGSSIRLLELLPARYNSDPIRCNLFEVSLNRPLQYEAVSYCWGASTLECAVFCHDQHLPVPASSDVALRALRLRTKRRIVWIDSVCINQSSTAERSHQVKLMAQIYNCARMTLVWLGPGTRETDLAFDMLSRLSKAMTRSMFRTKLSRERSILQVMDDIRR